MASRRERHATPNPISLVGLAGVCRLSEPIRANEPMILPEYESTGFAVRKFLFLKIYLIVN